MVLLVILIVATVIVSGTVLLVNWLRKRSRVGTETQTLPRQENHRLGEENQRLGEENRRLAEENRRLRVELAEREGGRSKRATGGGEAFQRPQDEISE
jgi:hypothetical protein